MTGARKTQKGFGLVEWFRTGDYERSEAIIAELSGSGASFSERFGGVHLVPARRRVPA